MPHACWYACWYACSTIQPQQRRGPKVRAHPFLCLLQHRREKLEALSTKIGAWRSFVMKRKAVCESRWCECCRCRFPLLVLHAFLLISKVALDECISCDLLLSEFRLLSIVFVLKGLTVLPPRTGSCSTASLPFLNSLAYLQLARRLQMTTFSSLSTCSCNHIHTTSHPSLIHISSNSNPLQIPSNGIESFSLVSCCRNSSPH